MDTGVPPTDITGKVARPEMPNATVPANGKASSNGKAKSNSAGSTTSRNGFVSKKLALKSPRARNGLVAPPRAHTEVASAPVAASGLLDDIVDQPTQAPMPLPPIMLAEPDEMPAVPVDVDTALVPLPVIEYSETDGTDGMPSLARPIKPMRPLRKPTVVTRRRPRVRRVTRVVRHVDTWSVFKVAVVFNLFLYGVCLTAGVLLWQVAQNTGTVDNVERFFENFGWETFQLKGGEIFHNAWIAGLFVCVGLTGLAVLMATMFNLITDLVGGIRVSVLEEEVVAREERGLGWRRLARRPTPAVGVTEPEVVVPAATPPEMPPPSQSA